MRSRALALSAAITLSAALAAPGCSRKDPAPTAEASSAAPLSIASPELPDDTNEQTRLALEQDAFRREARFQDAIEPGYLFGSTRVPQADIEAGKWPAAQLFDVGAQLFQVTFVPRDGYGAKDLPALARFHKGRRGGPDASSCNNCHWRGGPAGAGDGADNAYLDGDGDGQSTTLARNPRALVGAGIVELVAREMTAELTEQRDALVRAAKDRGKPLRAELRAKGVSFGKLGALADGALDTSALEGIDADLVVKPFGWKGTFASLRDAVEDELLVHHGMESEHLVRTAPPERAGPFGGDDPDGDGVTSEITEGQVTALVAYLAMQEVPTVEMPTRQEMLVRWSHGREQFQALGCAACHVPTLSLQRAVYELSSRAGAGRPLAIDLASEGADPRLSAPAAGGGREAWLFSDLKRHEMGERLAEGRADRGVSGGSFVTPPLWGLARSRPYLHDASAPTVEDAILAHGGEAQAARDAFAALPDEGRYPLRLYLASLTRASRMVSP